MNCLEFWSRYLCSHRALPEMRTIGSLLRKGVKHCTTHAKNSENAQACIACSALMDKECPEADNKKSYDPVTFQKAALCGNIESEEPFLKQCQRFIIALLRNAGPKVCFILQMKSKLQFFLQLASISFRTLCSEFAHSTYFVLGND